MVRCEENEIVGLYCGSRFISLREARSRMPCPYMPRRRRAIKFWFVRV